MAEANANIRIGVDTSNALAQIKQLQKQIALFHTSMAKGGAAAAAESRNLQRNLVNSINATGQFTANMTRINTTTESFTNALEKNKLSMGQYFRFAGASTKSFGRLFKTEFATINKVARERVKDLQTQYIKMGRDASGAMQAIRVRPTTLDLQNLGTQTAIAAQKQALLNQLIRQGSTNLLNWGKNTQWAGRQLMVGFTIPLTIMGAAASREFMKLEEQAVRFKRVYGDMFTAEGETEKALSDIRELAEEFTKYGVAVEKTVDLAASVAQMGAQGEDLNNQVREATRLAVLGGIEQQEALDTTISLTNAFGLETEQLTDKIAFLNAAENQTILSIEDFNEAVPKAGSVVKQLGGDVEDLAFFLTAMREGGINASQSANALKSSLARLINPTEVSKEKLGEFGIDILGIVNDNAGNLRETIQVLAVELDKLDPLDKSRAIEQLFGKFQFARMSTLFENIVKEGSQANKVLELTTFNSRELGVIAERELGRVEASSMFKFQKALEEFQAALAPFGEAFLKLVTPIVEFGTRLLDKFNQLSDGAKTFVVGFIGIVGAVGPALLMMIGLIANGIANLLLFGSKVAGVLTKTGSSTNVLTEQVNYMNSEQMESAAVAASLDQSHQNLIQTFNAEAGSIANLTAAYGKAIAAQQQFMSYGGAARGGARGAARGGAGTSPPFMPPKYAEGILSVPGPKGAGDVVAAMLSPGEAVIPADMAEKYAPFINSIIADNVPGFKYGKTVGGRVVEETHVAPALKKTDAVMGAISRVVPGFDRLGDKLQEVFIVLGDLTATKTRELNQEAKGLGRPPQDRKADRAMTGEEFLSEWNVTEGTGFDRTAERAGLLKLEDGVPGAAQQGSYEEGVPEALSELDREVGSRVAARIDAMPETEKAVEGWLDRLMEGVTQEVVSEFAEESGTAKAKVSTALAGRAATPAGLRTVGAQNVTNDATGKPYGSAPAFFEDMEAQGQLERREGRQGLFAPETDIKAARPNKTGGFRTNSISSSTLGTSVKGGTFEYPGGKGAELTAIPEAQDAYLEGQKSAEAHNDGVESVIKDPKDIASEKVGRASPHPDAFPDGADDARAYMDGQESVLGPGSDPYKPGSSLAPPTAPGVDVGTGGTSRLQKAKNAARKKVEQFGDTGFGQKIGKRLAQASGNALTDSQGNVTYDPNQDMSTWAGQMTAESEAQERAAREQTEAANKMSTAGDELIQGANELEGGANDLERAANKQSRNASRDAAAGGGMVPGGKGKKDAAPKPKGKGVTAGGMGLSMGLSALTMGASMAPGALGEQAQKMMPALMALSAAPMLFQALQSPLVAVLAAIAAVAGSIFMLNNKMKEAQKEAMEMGEALGSGADAMKDLAEFAGSVSSGEFMDDVRKERMTGVQTAPGKTTFGESFVEDEKGQALLEAAEKQIAQTGSSAATINSLTSKLSTAVMSGVLTKEQASSMASNLGFALNDMQIGLQVRANIAQLVGPNGEDLTGEGLVEFSAKVNADNMEAVDDQIGLMNRNLEGVFGDEQGEIVGGTVAAGVSGGVITGLATAAASAGLVATGTKIGAAVGTAMGGPIGLAIGAGVGMAAGAIGAYFTMKANAEEAGKLSGMVVSTMSNALQQQQELADAVDAHYIKKIEEAKVQGDITEQIRLQAEFEEKKVEMSKQEMAMREQLKGALTGPGAEAAMAGVDSAIETRYQDDADAQMALSGIDAALKDFDEESSNEIKFELASGLISPLALNSLLTFIGDDEGSKEALIDIIGTFGGVFADETGQVMSLIEDEDLASDIFVKISNAGNEQEAQEILDFVREIQRQDAVFDTDVILKYMQENEDVAEGLKEIFDRADMGVVSAEQAYEINPKLANEDAFDEQYFNMLGEADREQYVRTVSMILEMDEAELLASDDFKKWLGDEGQVHGPFPGNKHSNAKWQRLYAESMGQKVTTDLTAVDSTTAAPAPEEETGGGGGGGPQASDLDDLLKKLRDVRQSTIEMTEGWVASRAKLDELFGDGRNIKIFGGIEQQMRGLGVGQDLISMVVGMDPEEYERRKDELFQFDKAGNIIGVTKALGNMGRAMRAIALGDFQNEQERVLSGLNDQFVAMRKLTAAGMSTAAAYEAIKDSAFAAAVAREKDNDVIRETIRLYEKATETTRAFNAAQALATKNQETGDLRGAVSFIERNARSLSEAQKSAIMDDPDLQTLIMDPSVDPKTLRKALKNAEQQADLDLKIKKLTFDGLVDIFEDGFSKAMEAFTVKEKEIELDFEVKKEPFLEAIKEAEEDIADIRNEAGGLDDLEADLERISWQEEQINESYDERKEALNKVKSINDDLAKQQKSQLDISEALSRGDIAAAARAVQELRKQKAESAAKKQEDQLEISREKALADLVGNMGKTRKELEEEIKQLNRDIFNIEEQRLEPAERQIELLDRTQSQLVEGLTVLGKTRQEWERIENNVSLAKISSDKFISAMEEALGVVEDITNYWDNFDGQTVDLFVNVQQIGDEIPTPEEIEGAAAKPDTTGGSGSPGEDKEEILERYKGVDLDPDAGEARTPGETLEGTRKPLDGEDTVDEERGVFFAEETLAGVEARSEQKMPDLVDQLSAERDTLASHRERGRGDDSRFVQRSKERIGEIEAEIEALADARANAQDSLDSAEEALEARKEEIAMGDPMAIFNTGAGNLLDATNGLLSDIARDAEGVITGNIGGYFSDLGISVPDQLAALPNFWTEMTSEMESELQTKVGDFFNTLAANAGQNMGAVGNVFAQMPADIKSSFEQTLSPYFEEGLPGSLDNIGSWWSDFASKNPEKAGEALSKIQDQMLIFGNQAVTDLEGTVGTYWDAFGPGLQSEFEGSITPFVAEQARLMGISMDDYLVQTVAGLSDDPELAQRWNDGFAARFTEFSVAAAQAAARAESRLGQMGDSVPPELETNLANLLRGAMDQGQEKYQEVLDFIASVGDDENIDAALTEEYPGLMETGAALAAANLNVVPEKIEDLTDDEKVVSTLEEDFPGAFEDSGEDSGNKFGAAAVDKIQQKMDESDIKVTVTVEYDDPGPPGDGNIGGLMGPTGTFLRNNGGIIPYAKGGIAKYMSGGTVGGFGNYDSVPAMLTPGEFVVRREAVNKYGKDFFSRLNNTIYDKKPSFSNLSSPSFDIKNKEYGVSQSDTKQSGVMYNSNNYAINVNVKSDANPDQIARTVMQNIKKVDSQRIRSNRL